MGCSASRLEDEEAVQMCKDRRNFIKQAIEQRIRFASGHIAYIQSLKRISRALSDFVDGHEHYDSFSDSFTTPPFTPVKKLSPEIIGIPFKSSASALNQPEKIIGVPFRSSASAQAQNRSRESTLHIARYLRSGGSTSVSVEECPQPTETVRINSYYPMDHYGSDDFFATQSTPLNSSFFSSTYDRPSYPPASPRNSQWDSFWNPFSSLDTYGYAYQGSFDQVINDDDIAGLRQVREEEGIPELEEEGTRGEEECVQPEIQNERHEVDSGHTRIKDAGENSSGTKNKNRKKREVKEHQSKNLETIEVSETKDAIEIKITKEKEVVGKRESAEETPGFTVYLNRRPTSMTEIMKDIECQFIRICDCAHEVSVLLEASRAQYSSTSSEIAVKMMNPIVLFRSASSRSSSSRFFHAAPSSGYDGYESSSDYSQESCMISGSHQSTLDRLYEWEKKLYEEVKAGERIRIAFEKKYMQLRNQDVHGEEPSAVEKTRAVVRDLHTRLKVSIHSVESVSKRIETLRDEELHPQLIELLQGLAKMWRTTADCHRIQKRTIDEAKLLILASTAAAGKGSEDAAPQPRHPRAAAALEAELRNWRACLEAWVAAQRAYARALAGWALRCGDPGGGGARSPLSPPRPSGGAPAVLGLCVQWSRLLESVGEAQVVDGLDFFTAGIGSVSGRAAAEEEGEGDDAAAAAAMATAEMARRVLCAGMSVAVSSLADFAARSADGYEVLVRWGGDRRAES
ncbi:protein ROLLING AND ERECT LEAF 2-like [Musa acuminata AAA Group]|uniref:protein ROLLING AND ERECT LEAF 2-like n=1 Tax=Musa acuminata AAA Group TaxID=214697 RepID=UPI0031D1BFFC